MMKKKPEQKEQEKVDRTDAALALMPTTKTKAIKNDLFAGNLRTVIILIMNLIHYVLTSICNNSMIYTCKKGMEGRVNSNNK